MKFQDKVVLITGASRGIGRATALAFAREGAKVIINYFNNEAEALDVVKKVELIGGKALMFQADIREEEQVKNIINKSMEIFGKIDILLNNAGIVFDESYNNKTVEHWHDTINTNLIGQFLMIKHIIPVLSDGGKIINISSTNATTSFSIDAIDYDASKAGVIVMTKDFAQILSSRNILVNSILPG